MTKEISASDETQFDTCIGTCDELERETMVVWQRLKVICFSKDDSKEHSERKKKKRKTEEEK